MQICQKCKEEHRIVFKCSECGEQVCIGCMTNLGICKDCVVELFNVRYVQKIEDYKEKMLI